MIDNTNNRYGNNSIIPKLIPENCVPYILDENGNKVKIEVLVDASTIWNRIGDESNED